MASRNQKQEVSKNIEYKLKRLLSSVDHFVAFHEEKYPKESKEIANGVSISANSFTLLGKDKVIELFIKHTYKQWELDGRIDRDTTLKSILANISNLTGSCNKALENLYCETNNDLLEEYWVSVKKLIPDCLDYVYLMRDPILNEKTGKIAFASSYPHGKHSLSLKKLKSIWVG